MFGSGNKKYNSMNRKQVPYQEIEDFEDITTTPKPKFYQNVYSNIKTNNQNINNNINTIQNNRMNINSNSKKFGNNNININMNIANNKSNNIEINNTNINKAIMVLKNEFKKKDDKIKFLELKIADLEQKINQIINSNKPLNIVNNNNNNINDINDINDLNLPIENNNNNLPLTLNKNFTFGEKNSAEISQSIKKIDVGVGN